MLTMLNVFVRKKLELTGELGSAPISDGGLPKSWLMVTSWIKIRSVEFNGMTVRVLRCGLFMIWVVRLETGTRVEVMMSYPPESCFTNLSSAAFCSAAIEPIAETVNITRANMATVAAVLNRLFSG